MRCAIWYHLYNLKNVKNTHGGVLLLVKLLHGCFSRFLNSTNGIKSRNAPHIAVISIMRTRRFNSSNKFLHLIGPRIEQR